MLNKTKLILYIIGGIIIASSYFGIKVAYNKYVAMKTDMQSYRNNQRAYEDIISGKTSENRVLKLSNADLKQSNDKLIQSMDSIRKTFKHASNKPGDVSAGINTVIHNTVGALLVNNGQCVVDTTLKHNAFTSSRVILKDNHLNVILDVNNTEYLYVYTTSEFVNVYKNGWVRFWHFDWHKEDIDRYDIKNTNDLIKVGTVRVVKIRE